MINRRDWWRPENLVTSEQKCREISDLDELEKMGDFGSYRKVLMTGEVKGSMLEFHNDLKPTEKIKAISRFLGQAKPKKILDVGCGMGFTTAALANFYKGAEVLGIDVSKDAIDFAKSTHKGAKFLSVMISPKSERLGEFDLIYCIEFYPFTRTSDAETHIEFIEYFVKQLSSGGKIIIYQLWNNQESLSSVINKVIERLPNLVFISRRTPHPKLTRLLPTLLSWMANFMLEKFFNKTYSKTILIIQPKELK
jgi:2-polyprenyl-3-methyl-5-hydroxy-6-metoxy-1,4-benzoquinol methylase